ncbi:hypothetical protein BGZ94_009091 [Podila epigama]|nr:hypothetical protein BGZ94_009091 [Podila epigama]
MMIPRVSGTANNTLVQQFILDYFAKLNQTSFAGGNKHHQSVEHDSTTGDRSSKPISPKLKKRQEALRAHKARYHTRAAEMPGTGWHLEVDSFVDQTPFGPKNFTNIVLTKNPNAENRLVFAAHFDSKYFPPIDKPKSEWNGGSDTLPFIGAIDSAVPCAILLDLAASLDTLLDGPQRTDKDTTLQLIFFDGEEAFEAWSQTDSTYGSRRVLAKEDGTPDSDRNWAKWSSTQWAHRHSISIEERLWEAGLHGVQALSKARQGGGDKANEDDEDADEMDDLEDKLPLEGFMTDKQPWGGVEDDHIPFLHRGVPIFHVIPVPFPSVWHTLADDASAISQEVVTGWANIFRAFTVEYLSLLHPREMHKRDEL